jgi:anti-sigma regulatory factor (Ser/Thr protein kinase)
VLTNVVNYAYRDGAAHEIHVDLDASSGRLVIEVKDDGRPFNPLTISEPDVSADIEERTVGGLGIHFVRLIVDDLSYRRINGWNVLRLEKKTTDGAGA